ncbi:MAG: 1-deoxy-D-xylulose-5-phosphate synthase, partial [Ruminococcus sp.]|nr:1-deoxy-D-xylulose-5-phosphate synthase [Ruminococcus sp.]
AMNNCGRDRQRNLIVVLNDNNMSISKSVGALSKYLTSLRNTEKYLHTKRAVERGLEMIPIVGKSVTKGIKNVKDSVKSNILEQSTMFEDMGFIYLGPVNGHNLSELEEVFHMAKSYHQPVFIHVKTVKGKGYSPAEANPGEYHGISKFDIATGNPEVSAADSYSTVFGKELVKLADKDDKLCAITAAMKYGTGLQFFHFKYPNRFFDVGIAEQHAVTFAGGLASMGMTPVFAVYSTFLQRSYDQLVHDVAIGGLHVVLGVDRAGIVGEDGETHQGLLDVPMLSSIPNTVIYSPSCYMEMKMCMRKAIYEEKGLAAVRYPRGSEKIEFEQSDMTTEWLFKQLSGSETLIITYGRLYNEAISAQKELAKQEINCDILKLTKIFPLDGELGSKIKQYPRVVFFEESMGEGSISEKVGNILSELGYCGDYSRVTANGFVKQASVRSCLDKLGLTRCRMVDYIIRRSNNNGKA